MNWLTWRQYRQQAVAGYAALAVICAFLALTGIRMLHSFNESGLSHCINRTDRNICGDLMSAFSERYNSLQFFALFALIVPVLIGMFWGAPLVARELENGTHRLAWTQSVSRKRWMLSKLTIIGASTLAFSAILAVTVTWWSRPLVETGWQKFGPGIFDLRGFVPVAYMLFALALGIAAGVLIRKTLPAVFATLAGFTTVRVAVIFLRSHYMAAKKVVYAFGSEPARRAGDWIISRQTIDRSGVLLGSGRGFELGAMAQRCPGLIPTSGGLPNKEEFLRCAGRLGVRTSEVFQPASRYWTFQAIESAIFLALTASLVIFIVRRVKRLA